MSLTSDGKCTVREDHKELEEDIDNGFNGSDKSHGGSLKMRFITYKEILLHAAAL